jgi:Protein of unknown function (DUF2934)
MSSVATPRNLVPYDIPEKKIVRSETSLVGSQQAEEMEASIARLAYALWQQRGCPEGTSEQDWAEAEQQVRETPTVTAA